MKHTMSVILLSVGLLISACSNVKVERSITTHVKQLVQSDVLSVLPQSESEVLMYKNASEIEGEYFELASVEIKKVGEEGSSELLSKIILDEAKSLGGNGVLMIEETSEKDGDKVTQRIKAIAIYTLDGIPVSEPLASL